MLAPCSFLRGPWTTQTRVRTCCIPWRCLCVPVLLKMEVPPSLGRGFPLWSKLLVDGPVSEVTTNKAWHGYQHPEMPTTTKPTCWSTQVWCWSFGRSSLQISFAFPSAQQVATAGCWSLLGETNSTQTTMVSKLKVASPSCPAYNTGSNLLSKPRGKPLQTNPFFLYSPAVSLGFYPGNASP